MKRMIFLAGLVAIMASCGNSKIENSNEKTGIRPAFLENVKTEVATLSHPAQELLLSGKVECDPDKIMHYVPLIDGIVVRTYFSLGDKVERGQAMLDIRSSELSALQAEKKSLEAEEKRAERELKAAQSMFDDNMFSEIELLEAKSNLQQIQAELGRIKSDMDMYGTDKGNGIFTVHAPMSGYIVHKRAAPGSMISPDSDEVFTIADLSSVWIMANVYASDLLFVREGMDVEITSLSYRNERFEGKIDVLSQVFDPEERVLKARIVMKNDELKFKPEMFVMVKAKSADNRLLVAIPSEALLFDDNRYFVVTEQGTGQFQVKEVTLQKQLGKTSYIASGLQEGERVVVKNQLLIYSEMK
jgi:cobalt-zinc-cadmium efflux system membrane fusion protein